MRALTVHPGVAESARLDEVPELPMSDGSVLVPTRAIGACGANRGHYEMGARALARADHAWLSRLISRRVPIDRWQDALRREPDDVKVVIAF